MIEEDKDNFKCGKQISAELAKLQHITSVPVYVISVISVVGKSETFQIFISSKC